MSIMKKIISIFLVLFSSNLIAGPSYLLFKDSEYFPKNGITIAYTDCGSSAHCIITRINRSELPVRLKFEAKYSYVSVIFNDENNIPAASVCNLYAKNWNTGVFNQNWHHKFYAYESTQSTLAACTNGAFTNDWSACCGVSYLDDKKPNNSFTFEFGPYDYDWYLSHSYVYGEN